MNKTLSIGILTCRLTKGYGVDVVVNQQATELAKRGHHVTIYTLEHDFNYFPPINYRVKVINLAAKTLVRYLKTRKHGCLIAHTSPFFEVLPELSSFFTVIAYEHGDPTPELFPESERFHRKNIKDFKLKHVYPTVDSVIAISNFISKDIRWLDAKVIHNGADHLLKNSVSEKKLTQVQAKKLLGLQQDKLTLLTVSRLGSGEAHYKGLDLFSSIKKLLPAERYQFVVLGRGTEYDRRELEESGFHVIVNASNEALQNAYIACDIYIACSKWEGFNLPLVEAQMFGRLSLALDQGCHNEVCPHIFKDVESLAREIINLSESARIHAADKCVAYVRKFSWQTNVDTLEEHLKVICRNKGTVLHERFTNLISFISIGLAERPFSVGKKIWRIGKRAFREPVNFKNKLLHLLRRMPYIIFEWRAILARRLIYPRLPKTLKLSPPAIGLVSICILTKNKLHFIKPCIESILSTTVGKNVEILIGDTGSDDPDVLNFYETLPNSVKVHKLGFYHFSKCNNLIAKNSTGEILIFLNNDTKLLPGWLDALLEPFAYTSVGITGPKMLFEDGTIQHAGAEIFTRPPYRYVGWHPYSRAPADEPAANIVRVMPGVTGACLAIRRELFATSGGFDEVYREECQDLDLCLRAWQLGAKVIYTPRSVIYHFENGTRTLKESGFDRDFFRRRWRVFIDMFIFKRQQQSDDWLPHICISEKQIVSWETPTLPHDNLNTLPSPWITLKVPKNQIDQWRQQYSELFWTGRRLRILGIDEEDNVTYDN